MILGAYTLPYRAYPFERALDGIAGAGFRHVGIWNDHAGSQVIPADGGDGAIAAARRAIEARGLQPQVTFRFPSGAGDPVSDMRRTIEVASALGARFVLSSGPSPYAGRTFGERKRDMLFRREAEAYFAMLRQIAPDAERAGITVVLKPHMGVTGTGEDLADIVDLIDHPAVRICYDAGNIAYYEGLKPEDDLTTCAHYVRAVCIKDHRGARAVADFPIPGEGDIDHASLFRTLLAAGFAGPCLVERIDGQPSAEAMDAALARARVNLEAAAAAAAEASLSEAAGTGQR
ncbi:MAG TPA: sugar phosphate isomerase/epimerase family protein [Chloroflexota bacterium]|nr:sugar phosphate isomerase/epimerase family protein [Chloroflexota bacterium]